MNDINYISAWFGLQRWYDLRVKYAYKYAMSMEAIPHVAQSLCAIINAIRGKAKKCLILDLDNTLWGGVIADDGLGGLQLGPETDIGEAFSEFQHYVKGLRDRGVILAVCSKNDEVNAREGFSHAGSVLKLEDFSDFQANWNDKHINVRRISEKLNIGADSLVFVDDNPAERELVRSQERDVAVPEPGADITEFIAVLDKSGLFEAASVSNEDLRRGHLYADNAKRLGSESQFENYDDFLRSLEMSAEILPLTESVLDRVVQLANKTNQFNVTTRRLTTNETRAMIDSRDVIAIYGRLIDKFGDNGLISLMSGDISGESLYIRIWLMSCRVLKRGMEQAMLDQMVALSRKRGLAFLVGRYLPTAKNKLVSNLFPEMGFEPYTDPEGQGSSWRLDISSAYRNRNSIIRVNHEQ